MAFPTLFKESASAVLVAFRSPSLGDFEADDLMQLGRFVSTLILFRVVLTCLDGFDFVPTEFEFLPLIVEVWKGRGLKSLLVDARHAIAQPPSAAR